MKVLFLTNLLPYPLDNGGKIKTYSTLEALYHGGYDVDLLCFYEEKILKTEWIKNVEKYCRNVDCIQTKLTTHGNMAYMLKQAFLSIFSSLSFGLYKYKNKKMFQMIQKKFKENDYDIVYYDHLQLCVYHKYIENLNGKSKYILDEHNCEYMIMQRHYENAENILKKMFLKLEYKKLQKFEAKMLQCVDKVVVLSKEDKEQLDKITQHKFNYDIIPIGVAEHKQKDIHTKNAERLRLLFLGTMTWEPNRSGLLWFMQNVIPELEKQNFQYSLDIVGKNPSDEIVQLADKNEHINVAGYVESTEEYFEKCDVMIVPLFVGSGQRVKIIESFSRGFPVISTTVGAEGLQYIDGESILIADDETQFVKAINKMREEECYKEIAQQSRKIYENIYSCSSIQKKILESINSIEMYKENV